MKTTLAFAAALLCTGAANAALVTVEYTIPVASLELETYDPRTIDIVPSATLGDLTVSTGERLTGRFSYDSDTALTPNFGFFETNAVTHSITFGNSGKVINFDGDSKLYKSGDSVGLNGSNYGDSSDTSPYVMISSFWSPALVTTPANALPGAQSWQHYALSPSYLFQMNLSLDGQYLSLAGHDMSLRVISSVPEPTTYGMLAAGLGLIGLTARRRQLRQG